MLESAGAIINKMLTGMEVLASSNPRTTTKNVFHRILVGPHYNLSIDLHVDLCWRVHMIIYFSIIKRNRGISSTINLTPPPFFFSLFFR